MTSTVYGPNSNQMTVNPSGVQDVNGYVLNNLPGRVDVQVGDATASGVVNSADISLVKSKSGSVPGSTNFRRDVNADGNINSADISLVKSKSGTGLP